MVGCRIHDSSRSAVHGDRASLNYAAVFCRCTGWLLWAGEVPFPPPLVPVRLGVGRSGFVGRDGRRKIWSIWSRFIRSCSSSRRPAASRKSDERCGAGVVAFSSLVQNFGLGSASVVDALKIRWPGGAVQVFEGVPADRHLVIREPL
ncbi:MAG: hypothetical protein FJX76_29190 [Armatimonadetes bacterium]|nr:hypothetical protein [Armatimonadota bacterium]